MICNSLKECIEKTHHMEPTEKKRRRNGKQTSASGQKERSIYEQPLGNSPCCNESLQKGCIEFLDCRPQAACHENGKSYILNQSQEYPRHEIIMLHIDSGVITNPEADSVNKCDYVILVKDRDKNGKRKNTAILIELKGKAVLHALKQLIATLNQPEFQPAWNDCARVFGRIVCKASVLRIRSNDDFIAAKEAFLLRGGNLEIGEDSYTEEYGKL